jgi:hypothetical protein
LTAILFVAVGFLVGTPCSVLEPYRFGVDFVFEANHLRSGNGIELGVGWVYHIVNTLPLGLGWVMMIEFIAGLICISIWETRKALLLFTFPIVYYLAIGNGHTVYVRYMAPMTPFICLGAAFFTVVVSRRIAEFLNVRTLATVSVLFLTCAALVEPGLATVHLDIALSRRDSRLAAADWAQENLPDGSSVYETSPYGGLHLQPTPGSFPLLEPGLQAKNSWARTGESWLNRYRLPYLKNSGGKKFRVFTYIEWDRRFFSYEPILDTTPEFIVRIEYPLIMYNPIPDGIDSLIERAYTPRTEFKAIDVASRDSWFDQEDAFYLPFRGFGAVSRPGPNIRIFERKK